MSLDDCLLKIKYLKIVMQISFQTVIFSVDSGLVIKLDKSQFSHTQEIVYLVAMFYLGGSIVSPSKDRIGSIQKGTMAIVDKQ